MKYEAAKETRSVGCSRKTVIANSSSSSVRPGGIVAPVVTVVNLLISRHRQRMGREKGKLISYVTETQNRLVPISRPKYSLLPLAKQRERE